jgi:hypothetical protein
VPARRWEPHKSRRHPTVAASPRSGDPSHPARRPACAVSPKRSPRIAEIPRMPATRSPWDDGGERVFQLKEARHPPSPQPGRRCRVAAVEGRAAPAAPDRLFLGRNAAAPHLDPLPGRGEAVPGPQGMSGLRVKPRSGHCGIMVGTSVTARLLPNRGEGAAKRRMRGTRRQPRQTDSSLAATRPPLTLILSPVGERRCLGLWG